MNTLNLSSHTYTDMAKTNIKGNIAELFWRIPQPPNDEFVVSFMLCGSLYSKKSLFSSGVHTFTGGKQQWLV